MKYKYEVELDRLSDWCEFESDEELSEFDILERALKVVCEDAKLYQYKVEEN